MLQRGLLEFVIGLLKGAMIALEDWDTVLFDRTQNTLMTLGAEKRLGKGRYRCETDALRRKSVFADRE